MTIKQILAILPLAASGFVGASEISEPVRGAMGGAGYATSDATVSPLYNPALARSDEKTRVFGLTVNAAAFTSSTESERDLFDEAEATIVGLQETYSGDLTSESAREEMSSTLQRLHRSQADIGARGSFVISLPGDSWGFALFNNRYGDADIASDVSSKDLMSLESSEAPEGPLSIEDLSSSAVLKSGLVEELGLSFARETPLSRDDSFVMGLTVKKVDIETVHYRGTVESISKEEFSYSRATQEYSGWTADAGVLIKSGPFRYSFSGKNLVPVKYKIGGASHELSAQYTGAAGFVADRWSGEVALDANSRNSLTGREAGRNLRAGVEWRVLPWVYVRGGLIKDMEGDTVDQFTAGLGIVPFNTVGINISAIRRDGEIAGASAQFALTF